MEMTISGRLRSPDITSFRNGSNYFHWETKNWVGGQRGKEKPCQWKVSKLQMETLSLSSHPPAPLPHPGIVSICQRRGRKDGLVDKGRGAVDSSVGWPPLQLCCRHPVQPWASHHLPVPFLLLSKMGVKSHLLAFLGRTHSLGLLPSKVWKQSCRVRREKSPGSILPAGRHQNCCVSCEGSRAVSR